MTWKPCAWMDQTWIQNLNLAAILRLYSWRYSAVAIRSAPNMVLMAVGMQGSSVSGNTVVQLQQEPVCSVYFLLLQPPGFLKHKISPPRTLLFIGGERVVKKKKGCIQVKSFTAENKIAMRCRLRWSTLPTPDGPIRPIPHILECHESPGDPRGLVSGP